MGQDASSRLAGAGGDLGHSVWLLHNHPAWWARPTPGTGNGAPERGREAFLSQSAAGKPQRSPPCKGHLSSTAQGSPAARVGQRPGRCSFQLPSHLLKLPGVPVLISSGLFLPVDGHTAGFSPSQVSK